MEAPECELCKNIAVGGYIPTTRESLVDHIHESHPQDIALAIGNEEQQRQKRIRLCSSCSKLHASETRCPCSSRVQRSNREVRNVTQASILSQIEACLATMGEVQPNPYQPSVEPLAPTQPRTPSPETTAEANMRDTRKGKTWYANLIANFSAKGKVHYTCEAIVLELATRMMRACNACVQGMDAMSYYTAFSILPGLIYRMNKRGGPALRTLKHILSLGTNHTIRDRILSTARTYYVKRGTQANWGPSSTQFKISSIERDVKDGFLTRAFNNLKSLSDEEAHIPYDQQRTAMRQLNPQAPDVQRLEYTGDLSSHASRHDIIGFTSPMEARLKVLKDHVARLDKKSSNGPSGWDNALIKKLIRKDNNNHLTSAILEFFDRICEGTAHAELTYLFTISRGVVFCKPTGGYRPVAIADAWYRLLARIIAQQVASDISENLLKPVQLGICAGSGCQIATKALQAAYDQGLCLSTIDIQNAFNTIPRTVIVEAITAKCPRLLPLFHSIYGHASEIRHSNGQLLCYNHTGVRQGDPLSSLFFCLGIQASLQEIDNYCKSVSSEQGFTVAYMDDITIAASASMIDDITREAKNILSRNGFSINEPKCQQLCATLTSSPAGLKILGVPIGSTEFIRTYLSQQLEDWTKHLSKLNLLSPQAAYRLLKFCINNTPNYMAKCVEWPIVEPILDQFDQKIDVALATIVDPDKPLPSLARQLRGLPEDLAGLAMYRQAGYHGQKAQYTARCEALKFVGKYEQTLGFLLQTMDQWPSFQFQDICVAFETEPDTMKVPPTVPPAHPPSRKPPTIEQQVCDKLHQLMWYRIANSTIPDASKAMLMSFSHTNSAQLLKSYDAHFLTEKQYRDTLKLRLLVSPFVTAGPTPCPRQGCNNDLHRNPGHCLSCLSVHSLRIRKHNAIAGVLANALKKYIPNVRVRREVSFLTQGGATGTGKSVVADIVVERPDRRPLLIDVSATNPSCMSLQKGSARNTKHAARLVEKLKAKHYEKIHDQDFDFVPFIIETSGQLGDKAIKFCEEILPIADARNLLYKRVNYQLHHYQAQQVHAMREILATAVVPEDPLLDQTTEPAIDVDLVDIFEDEGDNRRNYYINVATGPIHRNTEVIQESVPVLPDISPVSDGHHDQEPSPAFDTQTLRTPTPSATSENTFRTITAIGGVQTSSLKTKVARPTAVRVNTARRPSSALGLPQPPLSTTENARPSFFTIGHPQRVEKARRQSAMGHAERIPIRAATTNRLTSAARVLVQATATASTPKEASSQLKRKSSVQHRPRTATPIQSEQVHQEQDKTMESEQSAEENDEGWILVSRTRKSEEALTATTSNTSSNAVITAVSASKKKPRTRSAHSQSQAARSSPAPAPSRHVTKPTRRALSPNNPSPCLNLQDQRSSPSNISVQSNTSRTVRVYVSNNPPVLSKPSVSSSQDTTTKRKPKNDRKINVRHSQ